VILSGVPATASEAERESEDKATTMEMLKELKGYDAIFSNINRFKANSNKKKPIKMPLPIRVTFEVKENFLLSLIDAKVLKDSVKYKSDYFSKDLSSVHILFN
jgi:hypothetical protein